jgi:hypothetical protein
MERIIDGISSVSSDEAASELSTTQLKIMMLLKEKALIGEEVDGEWFVTRDSIECFKSHGKDMKIEMGCKTYCSSGGCGCKG